MSKLYKRYLSLKEENFSKIYLFKSGIFYIFLENDAIKMSRVLNLKLTNLNTTVLKCGFPVSTLNKYMNILQNLGYDVEIIDQIDQLPISTTNYILNNSINDLLSFISSIDSNTLSISEAYSFIDLISDKAQKILKEMKF